MWNQLIRTDNNLASFVLRLGLGLVIFPHGAQKLLGWFGGYGFSGTMGFLTGTAGLPWIIGFGVIMIEFFGSLLLILGLAGRLNAALIGAVMLGALLTSHTKYFFMNWSGQQAGEGFEYHLLALAIAVAIVVRGSGRFSVDRALTPKSETAMA